MTGRSARWSGAAGIVALACFVAETVLLRHTPSTEQPTSDITAWFSDHRAVALTATYLLGLGATFLLVFVGGLRQRLRQDDDLDAAAGIAFAGGIGLSLTMLLAAAALAVLAFRPDTDSGVARALYDANGLLVVFALFPAAALVAASSVVALRRGVLPRWLGWAGLVVAALALVGAASVQQSGWFMPQADIGALPIASAAFMLWLLATSITLLRVRAAGGTVHTRTARRTGVAAA